MGAAYPILEAILRRRFEGSVRDEVWMNYRCLGTLPKLANGNEFLVARLKQVRVVQVRLVGFPTYSSEA
jgi:hypothetical protein